MPGDVSCHPSPARVQSRPRSRRADAFGWTAKEDGQLQRACWTVSRFLYPEGRQSFLWARHYCQALATYPEVERSGPLLLPYLVLLRMGFALPDRSLHPRCALTAPFHPYRKPSLHPDLRRYIFCGTFREIRFERTPPAVSRHAALWRPDFPPAKRVNTPRATTRTTDPLNSRR